MSLDSILMRPVYDRTTDPLEPVLLLLDDCRKKILPAEFAFTCPIRRLALEIDPSRRKIHQKIAANFNARIAAVRKCLQDAAVRFSPQHESRSVGIFLTRTVLVPKRSILTRIR